MSDRMEGTSLRLRKGTLAKLRTLACLETLRTGRPVSWAELVRNVIETSLLNANNGPTTVAHTEKM
jgi:hypothetical protein